MGHRVGQQWAIYHCAVIVLAQHAIAAPPPTTRPVRATRIDLLYLQARLLIYDAGFPEQARPVLDLAARQKTWAASRTPVALLTAQQVEALLDAYNAASGTAIVPAAAPMLASNRRVTAAPRKGATTSPAARPRFEVTATAGTVDGQGAIPLKLTATATATFPPASPDRTEPFTATWSADLGVAAPVEQILLVDLGTAVTDGPTTPGRPPRALLLICPSAHPVEQKGPAAALQVAGDLYRSWDRVWPLLNQMSAMLQARHVEDARQQVAIIREQIRPVLDSAEGTDYDRSAHALAEDLDATATALRKFDLKNATLAFMRFRAAGDKLHLTLSRLMADTGRLPSAPATRPN